MQTRQEARICSGLLSWTVSSKTIAALRTKSRLWLSTDYARVYPQLPDSFPHRPRHTKRPISAFSTPSSPGCESSNLWITDRGVAPARGSAAAASNDWARLRSMTSGQKRELSGWLLEEPHSLAGPCLQRRQIIAVRDAALPIPENQLDMIAQHLAMPRLAGLHR